jgi:hypothetical protein
MLQENPIVKNKAVILFSASILRNYYMSYYYGVLPGFLFNIVASILLIYYTDKLFRDKRP